VGDRRWPFLLRGRGRGDRGLLDRESFLTPGRGSGAVATGEPRIAPHEQEAEEQQPHTDDPRTHLGAIYRPIVGRCRHRHSGLVGANRSLEIGRDGLAGGRVVQSGGGAAIVGEWGGAVVGKHEVGATVLEDPVVAIDLGRICGAAGNGYMLWEVAALPDLKNLHLGRTAPVGDLYRPADKDCVGFLD